MADCIDRLAAIAYAISGRIRTEDGENWIRVQEVRENLLNVPSAQPEPKTGHWIETDDGDLQCSECGRITGEVIDEYEPLNADLTSAKYGFTIPKGSPIWALKHPYFCAKCGADMREVDTDD